MTTPRRKNLVILFLAGMAIANALAGWELHAYIQRGFSDFSAFYTAGKLVQSGRSAEMYSLPAQREMQQGFAPDARARAGPLPYIRPPFEALLFLPLAYLPYPAACALWLAINVGILVAIPIVLKPFVIGRPLLPGSSAGWLALAFFPVAADLVQGQDAILLTLCFALALAALRRGADLWCGIFLALGLFKFHLVLPLFLVLLLKGKWRVGTGFVAAGVVLVLISVLLVGWPGLAHYPRYVWNLNAAHSTGVAAPQEMPNLRGLTSTLLGTSGSQQQLIPLFLAIGAAGVLLVRLLWRSNASDPRLITAGFSLSLTVTILTSYYAYSFDMLALLLPAWLLGGIFLRDTAVPKLQRRMFIGAFGLLALSPLLWFLVLRSAQFHWVALVILLLLSGALASVLRMWERPALAG